MNFNYNITQPMIQELIQLRGSTYLFGLIEVSFAFLEVCLQLIELYLVIGLVSLAEAIPMKIIALPIKYFFSIRFK